MFEILARQARLTRNQSKILIGSIEIGAGLAKPRGLRQPVVPG